MVGMIFTVGMVTSIIVALAALKVVRKLIWGNRNKSFKIKL